MITNVPNGVKQCHEQCLTLDHCRWFSYSKHTDSCLLFQTWPTIEENPEESYYYDYHTFEASCNEVKLFGSL